MSLILTPDEYMRVLGLYGAASVAVFESPLSEGRLGQIVWINYREWKVGVQFKDETLVLEWDYFQVKLVVTKIKMDSPGKFLRDAREIHLCTDNSLQASGLLTMCLFYWQKPTPLWFGEMHWANGKTVISLGIGIEK